MHDRNSYFYHDAEIMGSINLSSSVPCKRTFSEAGYTIIDRRNRLSVKNTKQLLFLNYYLKFILINF